VFQVRFKKGPAANAMTKDAFESLAECDLVGDAAYHQVGTPAL
jgi:hypothetical protein